MGLTPSRSEDDVSSLLAAVTTWLAGPGRSGLLRLRTSDESQRALVEALGRALSSSDIDGFVHKGHLAFAVGDEIVYPHNGREAEALVRHNTAIVQHLERADPVFHTLVSEIQDRAGRAAALSAYIAEIDARAFSWHVDDWDNIVVQMQGSKGFDVAGAGPCRLGAGDVLLLPRNLGHRTRALERSIHLSLAVFP